MLASGSFAPISCAHRSQHQGRPHARCVLARLVGASPPCWHRCIHSPGTPFACVDPPVLVLFQLQGSANSATGAG